MIKDTSWKRLVSTARQVLSLATVEGFWGTDLHVSLIVGEATSWCAERLTAYVPKSNHSSILFVYIVFPKDWEAIIGSIKNKWWIYMLTQQHPWYRLNIPNMLYLRNAIMQSKPLFIFNCHSAIGLPVAGNLLQCFVFLFGKLSTHFLVCSQGQYLLLPVYN